MFVYEFPVKIRLESPSLVNAIQKLEFLMDGVAVMHVGPGITVNNSLVTEEALAQANIAIDQASDDLGKMNFKISNDLLAVFVAEQANEGDGGVSPSTLASTLDSINQGAYDDGILDLNLKAEVEGLIARFGEDTDLEDLI